jgi:hypothetical protein
VSEPPESAPRAEQIAPGLYHWSVKNSNIGGNTSASHAVATDGGSVWIDPVRVDDPDSLPAPEAIVLTSRGHQRSAWHYRELLGVQVWAPQGGEGYEQEPDVLYGADDQLPGGLQQLATPGFGDAKFALHRGAEGDSPSFMLVGDLLSRDAAGQLRMLPPQFQSDPAAAHESLRAVAGERFQVLMIGHGGPEVAGGDEQVRAVLEATPAP